MIQEIIMPVGVIGGLGLIFGLSLAFASKKFEVKVDERIAPVREALPGVNCGACGYTGCDGFAEALVGGSAKVNGCPVGGSELPGKLGNILGVEVEEIECKAARVMCKGSYDKCNIKFNYAGIEDCAAAANLFGGPSSCTYGCVGMGSCVRECPFDAIVMDNGVAKILQAKCTACAKCVVICPKKIIKLVPVDSEYTVSCSSLDKGGVVRKICSVGCIGCGKCTKVCPSAAIKLNGTLAEILPENCTNCGECMKVCPTGSINIYDCRVKCGV